MRDPERPIERRIRESKKPLNASERRAELLKRNPEFARELNSGPVKFPDPQNEYERNFGGWTTDDPNLHGILYRWGISTGWDGRLGSLGRYAYKGPSIFFRDPVSRRAGVIITGRAESAKKIRGPYFLWKADSTVTQASQRLERDKEYPVACFPGHVVEEWIKRGSAARGSDQAKTLVPPSWAHEDLAAQWPREVEKERAYIYVKIAPATNRGEYERLWPAIEKLKKRIFYSERTSRTFERDLCFWDLHRDQTFGKKSYVWIRQHWPEKILETTIRHGIDRIQGSIDRLSPKIR